MSLQEFCDYVTNSGVNFDILTIKQKREWRETFDKSRALAPGPPETLTILIRHWENLNSHSIVLSKLTSYHIFEAQVGELFSDEIGSSDFRLYTLPVDSEDLDEKLRLTAENFPDFVEQKFSFSSSRKPRRTLYVSSTDSTPKKPPMSRLTTSNLSTLSGDSQKSSLGDSNSKVSRNSRNAIRCKNRDKFTCRICQLNTNDSIAKTSELHAAYIYEIEELQSMPKETRISLLEEMQLYDINHPINLITLCTVCHRYFDKQQIGIDPESKSWIITASIANNPSQTGFKYEAFHGKTAGFDAIPSFALLAHRYERFTAQNYSKEVVEGSVGYGGTAETMSDAVSALVDGISKLSHDDNDDDDDNTVASSSQTGSTAKHSSRLQATYTDDDNSVIEISPPDKSTLVQSQVNVAHKDLFPFDWSDIFGTVLVTLGILIAASGGIGGGGILVPLLILVYGFSPKNAVALSNFCIVGSSITNMVLNIYKRHPLADRPLVDWDLILVMEPITMAGAVIGAFMSVLLPEWLLVISLVALLAFTTWTTLEKGISQFKKESKEHAAAKKSELAKATEKQLEMQELEEAQPLLGEADADATAATAVSLASPAFGSDNRTSKEVIVEAIANAVPTESSSSLQSSTSTELQAILQQEKSTPMDKAAILSGMVLVVIVLNLLKGGSGKNSFPSPLGVQCGSTEYWLLTATVIVFVVVISLWMRSGLVQKWKLKKRVGYRYCEGDMEWNEYNTIIYPCLCFFAGFSAGMFGVGGGIVKGPLMLHMGVHPLVASATCAVMIMFTSVAATTMFIAFGTLIWDYGIFLFVIGLVATVVGQFGVSYLVVKYKRVSLVSLSIGAVVALSTVLMAVQSVFSLIDATQNKSSSQQLCSG
eukprot:gene26734-35414_t